MTGQTCIYGGVSTKQKMDRGIHANTGFMHAPYGKDWCVPSRRESRYVFSKPLSSRCCRAEGSDFIPGHSLTTSRRRDEYSCASGPLGKDARLLQPNRWRSSSAERSMIHNDSSDRNSGQATWVFGFYGHF